MSEAFELPLIRRAREFHVYDQRGTRYVDLYRANGAALLGHSVPGLTQAVKNRLESHVYDGYPHVLSLQVQRALKACFPGRQVHLFRDRWSLAQACHAMGLAEPAEWRPFLPPPLGPFRALLPGLVGEEPAVLVAAPAALVDDQNRLSPPGLAALLRLLPLLEMLGAFAACGHSPKVDQRVDRHSSTIGLWEEAWWSRVKLGQWRRQGPYLVPTCPPETYPEMAAFALSQGVVVNPWGGWSILPGLLTAREQKSVEAVLSFGPEADHANADH